MRSFFIYKSLQLCCHLNLQKSRLNMCHPYQNHGFLKALRKKSTRATTPIKDPWLVCCWLYSFKIRNLIFHSFIAQISSTYGSWKPKSRGKIQRPRAWRQEGLEHDDRTLCRFEFRHQASRDRLGHPSGTEPCRLVGSDYLAFSTQCSHTIRAEIYGWDRMREDFE